MFWVGTYPLWSRSLWRLMSTTPMSYLKPGEAIGYPAQLRLIRPSVCQSLSQLSFNYSAENYPGPTDLVKYSLKIVD